MIKYINETTKYLKEKGFANPEIGIILGTGLGKLIEEVEVLKEVSYNQIPNFPTATVEFHKGKTHIRHFRREKSCCYARSFSFI